MTSERVQKVKDHFEKHKTIYCCVGTGIVVAGFTGCVMRSIELKRISRGIAATASRGIAVTGESTIINNAPKTLLGTTKILNEISYIEANRQGPPSWVIRCVETGAIFASQRAAALEMALSETDLSQHLTGRKEHAQGFHFERICMAA